MNKIIYLIFAVVLLTTACKKQTDPIDVSNATITLQNAGTGFVVDNITVNPNDSIFFSYTVTSNKDMKFVSIQKNPTNQTAFIVRDTLTTTQKNNYTAVKRLRADSINGSAIYHIVAHDKDGKYIGHKALVVTTKSDYDYYTFRLLQVPDSTAKTNTCYMDATKGIMYSYTSGTTKSADIDFGLMYDTTGKASSSTTDDLRFCLYALSAPQGQLPYNDISTWTKNATIMKKITSPTFTTITSGGLIKTTCNTNLTSGTTNKITQLVAGNMVAFRTASGKQGILLVNFANGNNENATSYLNVDVKIAR